MYLANKLIQMLDDKLTRKAHVNLIKKEDLLNLRIAGLLHDLGHGPFSHSLENVLERNSELRPEVMSLDGRTKATRHEQFTSHLILSDESEVHRVLRSNRIDHKTIVRLVEKGQYEEPLEALGSIITGDTDVDSIDYVIRDSYHIGYRDTVREIDYERILGAFDADRTGDQFSIYVPEEEISKVDTFMLLRSLFLRALPKHPQVRCADLMLTSAVETALKNVPSQDRREKVREIFTKMVDSDLIQFLEMDEHASEIVARLKTNRHFGTYDIRLTNLEPEDRYNLYKMHKALDHRLAFESEVKQAVSRKYRNARRPALAEMITDFNFSRAFPVRLRVRNGAGFHFYIDVSALARGIGKGMFNESKLSFYYKEELTNLRATFDLMKTSVMREIIPKVLEGIVPHDSDIVLMLLYASDKVARQKRAVFGNSSIGPHFKGLSKLHRLVESLLSKEQKLECCYRFELHVGARTYDEDMWKDLLALVDSGLVTEEILHGIDFEHMGETYRLHKRYRITRLGREYVERYFGATTTYDSILHFVQSEYHRLKVQRKRLESVVQDSERLLSRMNMVGRTSERDKVMKKVIDRQKEIDKLKAELPVEIDYVEDIL